MLNLRNTIEYSLVVASFVRFSFRLYYYEGLINEQIRCYSNLGTASFSLDDLSSKHGKPIVLLFNTRHIVEGEYMLPQGYN